MYARERACARHYIAAQQVAIADYMFQNARARARARGGDPSASRPRTTAVNRP